VAYRDIKKRLYQEYRKNAKNRKLQWLIEYPYFLLLINQDCFYCGASPTETRRSETDQVVKANGLDRVDPYLGYIKGNIVPCCKDCNSMKWNMKLEDFFKKVSEIYETAQKNKGPRKTLES